MKQISISRKSRGFTLIEIMIVVVVIAILAAFAIPGYEQSLRKSKRSDAKSALVDASSRLEQYYLDNKSYTIDMTELDYSALTNVDTSDGYYQIAVKAGSCGSIAACYKVQAIPQGDQLKDTCGTFTIDSTGIKTPSDCW